MIIVNFILFLLCGFSFIGFLGTMLLGLPWISFFFFVFFCFMYYAFRLDHTKEEKPKEIILTHRVVDANKPLYDAEEYDTDLDDFNNLDFRNKMNFG